MTLFIHHFGSALLADMDHDIGAAFAYSPWGSRVLYVELYSGAWGCSVERLRISMPVCGRAYHVPVTL